MKKLHLLLVLILFVIILNGQEESKFNTGKTEINIGISNIFSKYHIYYDYFFLDGELYPTLIYDNLYRSPSIQFGLKLHDSKGAFRLATTINYNSLNQKDDNNPDGKTSYTAFGSSLRLGYEWHKAINRVVIYYGFDVHSRYISRKFNYENTYWGGPSNSETKVNEYTIGASPLIGVNVFLMENLSIGTEIRYEMEYYNSTEKTSNDVGDEGKSDITGFRSYFGPLGFLSVNIHL